jgi:hypothetical protein
MSSETELDNVQGQALSNFFEALSTEAGEKHAHNNKRPETFRSSSREAKLGSLSHA